MKRSGAACHLLASIAVAGLMAACTSGAPEPRPTVDPSPSAPEPSIAPTSRVAAHRGCDSGASILSGEGWRAEATVVGPAAFVPLAYRFGGTGFERVQPDAAGWRHVKVMMALETGMRVTVAIPPTHRDVGSLTYRGGHDHEVSFVACDPFPGTPPETQFSGGFAVRRPVCLPVDVSWSGTTARIALDFGVGNC
jgi:hypothetical protein